MQAGRVKQRSRARTPLAICLAIAFVSVTAGDTLAADSAFPRLGEAQPWHGDRVDAWLAAQALRMLPPITVSGTPPRPAGGTPVTSCEDDDSPGTLRNVVAAAVTGDTIDLSGLACSTITLAHGQIRTTLNDLRLRGPADGHLTIDGNHANRVVAHEAFGTLGIDHLRIVNGTFNQPGNSFGGCIYSQGSVVLDHAVVSGCRVGSSSDQNFAAGAGVFAYFGVSITASRLSGNIIASHGGGGAAASIDLPMTVADSTIDGNHASSGGGLYCYSGAMTVTNSTISGNSAVNGGGVMSFATSSIAVDNSTIAFNDSVQGGGGVYIHSTLLTMHIASSIIANNTSYQGLAAADIGSPASTLITGDHNLVEAADAALPADTLSADPQLLSLADVGGGILMHVLPAGSIAIDAGSNGLDLPSDQRGDGYPRRSGPAADIGAYELQVPGGDVVFADGFEESGATAR